MQPMLKSLLIVDDEPLIHEVLIDGLKDCAEEIKSCTHFDEAMKTVETQGFDCIILDINLHGENGGRIFTYLERQTNHINARTPVILISGYIGADFIARHNDRFYQILAKPFQVEELRTLIKALIVHGQKKEAACLPEKSKEAPPPPVEDELFNLDCETPFDLKDIAPKIRATIDKIKKNNRLRTLFTRALSEVQSQGLYKTHIGLTINVGAGLLKAMGWDSDQTLEKLVYAAYLHDIALKTRPELLEFQTNFDFEIKGAKLSEEDVNLIKTHPLKAAEILKDYPEIPPDVPEMIMQHHERADGGGFPAGIDHNRITPLATLFILAHEMAHAVAKTANFDLRAYISEVTKKHRGPHFRKVTRAMSSLL